MEIIMPVDVDIKAMRAIGIQFKGLCIKNGAKIHTNEASIILLPIIPSIVGLFNPKLSRVSLPKHCIIISKTIRKNIDCIAFLTGSKSTIFVQAK